MLDSGEGFVGEAYGQRVCLKDYPALADHCSRAEAREKFKAIGQSFIPSN